MRILHIRVIRLRIDIERGRKRPPFLTTQKAMIPQMIITIANRSTEYGTPPQLIKIAAGQARVFRQIKPITPITVTQIQCRHSRHIRNTRHMLGAFQGRQPVKTLGQQHRPMRPTAILNIQQPKFRYVDTGQSGQIKSHAFPADNIPIVSIRLRKLRHP